MNQVKNLSQFKKAIASKQKFKILKHYVKEEFTGQIRTPNWVQSNGFYSIIEGEPNHPVTVANGGKGYWLGYDKASHYEFREDSILIKLSDTEPCMEIAFI